MTKQQAQKFLSVLDQLPAEVRYYFQSELSAKNILALAEKHQVNKDALDDLVIVTTIGGFDYNQIAQEVNHLSTNNQLAQQIIIDFLGMVLLPIDDYINLDVASILSELGAKQDDYNDYVNDYKYDLDDQSLNMLNEYIDEATADIDIEEETTATVDWLTNNLLEILQEDDVDVLIALNRSLIYLLNNDPGIIRKLENILLNNQNRITKEAIIVNGKSVEPTVANWLHNFIAEIGAGHFDSLMIADYLVRSNNVKNLNATEKQILQKLLSLYYNLKFYPDNMTGKPLTDWFIVPIPETALSKTKVDRQPIRPTQPVRSVPRTTTQSVPSQEQSMATVLKLQKMAEQYPVGSLERLAIEEEIKKMK
ncbi:MAG: hypothetical protein V1765_02020 [bacterium]